MVLPEMTSNLSSIRSRVSLAQSPSFSTNESSLMLLVKMFLIHVVIDDVKSTLDDVLNILTTSFDLVFNHFEFRVTVFALDSTEISMNRPQRLCSID